MPTNPYISQEVRSEQMLYEDIVIEALKMYGQEIVYLPREPLRTDDVLNEDFSRFRASYTIEMYIANTEGFEGEGTLLSKFGLEIRDQATFVVSKRRFNQYVDILEDNLSLCESRPREGDLIYLPLSNSMFQIKFVEHEKPFYQISDLPVFELQCELFEYAGEIFDTGVEAIDAFQHYHGSQYTIEIQGGEIGFAVNDEISQTVGDTTIYGIVSGFDETQIQTSVIPRTANLYLSHLYAEDGSLPRLIEGESITNVTRDHSDWSVTKIYGLDDGDDFNIPSDPGSDNSTYEVDADEIIDFSEINPFGEPT